MVKQRRFNIGKAPFIRIADSTRSAKTIMTDFVIALLPLILFAWYKNGIVPFIDGNIGILGMLYPLLFIITGGLTCLVVEGLYYSLFMKVDNIKHKLQNSYALIPGLLLAMISPLHTPIWVLILGCIFASVIAKLLFGGLGYNIFNPALAGYLFVVVAFYPVILANGGILNASEASEIVSGATPLASFLSDLDLETNLQTFGGLGNIFLGMTPGAISETSAALCILAFVYLMVRRVIHWRLPVIYVVSVFVFTYIIGAFNGYATDLRFPLYNIFTGGLFFGAIFMATEPVSTPRTPNGEIVFSLFLGVLTVMLRYISNMNEGVAVSILFMNLFTPLIDNVCAKIRVLDKPFKMVKSYAVISLIILLIFGFTLMQFGVFA